MRKLSICAVLLMSVALVADSPEPAEARPNPQPAIGDPFNHPPGPYQGFDCSGSQSCTLAGTVNGCTYNAGRVPNCTTVTGNPPPTCDYTVPGYICSGVDANNAPCSKDWKGCQ